jgi:hypothetical protein
VLTRATARGRKNGMSATATVEVVVEHNWTLGFTAMQQATGWHAACRLRAMARGDCLAGTAPVELAIERRRTRGEGGIHSVREAV